MQVGRQCSMNVNTGTFATPVWSAAGRVSSPKINMARPTSRKVYRESPNSKSVTGVRDIGLTFTYIVRGNTATDAVLTLLLNSFNNDTVLDMAALDRPAGSGAKGIRGPFQVSQMNKNEDDEDAVSYDVTIVEVEDDVNANFNAGPYTMT
jgi:hypothetical protein